MRTEPPPSEPGAKGSMPLDDGDRRAPAGPAGAELGVPRVARGRRGEGFRVGGEPELGRVRLAEADGAGVVQRLARSRPSPRGRSRPSSRDPKPVGRRRASRGPCRRRAGPRAARFGAPGGDLVRARERRVPRDRDEGAELRVQAFDAVQVVGGEFAGRDASRLQLLPEFERGELVEFGHPPRLSPPPDCAGCTGRSPYQPHYSDAMEERESVEQIVARRSVIRAAAHYEERHPAWLVEHGSAPGGSGRHSGSRSSSPPTTSAGTPPSGSSS